MNQYIDFALFIEILSLVDDEVTNFPRDVLISRDAFYWRATELSLDFVGNLDSGLL